MKKFLVSFVLIFTFVFQSFSTGTFASDISITPIKGGQSINISKNIGWGEIQPLGIKSWIGKQAMLAIAYALRYTLSGVSGFLSSIGAPVAIVREISTKATQIATTLERIAMYFDYYSTTISTTIYQQLQAQGFSQQVSYWVSQLVSFVTF